VRDDGRAKAWERRSELPLGVASLLFLGAYAVHVLGPGLPTWVHVVCLTVICASWASFVADFLVRWGAAGLRLGFVRRHWLDAVVVALPLLRPLRVVRFYEAVQRRNGRPRLSLHVRVMLYAGLSAVLLGFAASLTVYQHERTAPHATIHTFGDSVWWACSTLATVGYGDVAPVTVVGRLVAVGLMACGLALLGAVTGSFSSWLVGVFTREEPPES
jgi:voltage-gated potassium channel